jgi:hypothetical protein
MTFITLLVVAYRPYIRRAPNDVQPFDPLEEWFEDHLNLRTGARAHWNVLWSILCFLVFSIFVVLRVALTIDWPWYFITIPLWVSVLSPVALPGVFRDRQSRLLIALLLSLPLCIFGVLVVVYVNSGWHIHSFVLFMYGIHSIHSIHGLIHCIICDDSPIWVLAFWVLIGIAWMDWQSFRERKQVYSI